MSQSGEALGRYTIPSGGRMDRIEEWRLFASVAAHGGFAAAARAHACSPQATTRAVAALESRLGIQLINRTTRSISLTVDGRRYLELAQRLVAGFDRIERPVDQHGELRGTLSITAPILFGQQYVVPVLGDFLEAQPRVDARVQLDDSVLSLAEHGIDVGVRIGTPKGGTLRALLLGHVSYVTCASPAYLERAGEPRTPGDLESHSCIAFTATSPRPEQWSFWDSGKRERAVTVRARLVVNTGRAAIDAAVAGLGIVRVLSYQIESFCKSGALRTVLSEYGPAPVPVHIVSLTGHRSRSARAFVKYAADGLKHRLRALTGVR